MSTRDPRIDPKAGDVVEIATGAIRRVQRVVGGVVFYCAGNSSTKSRWCWISVWREWASRKVK